jgi:hypothetical protein
LQELEWQASSSSVEPLLGLQQLRRVELQCLQQQQLDAKQLQQLSSLSRLSHVSLAYDQAESITAATAAAWRQLLLRALPLCYSSSSDKGQGLAAAVIQQLGRLQGLTRLELSTSSSSSVIGKNAVLLHVSPKQLAAALQPLKALRQLHVEGFGFAGSGGCSKANNSKPSGAKQQPLEQVLALVEAVCRLLPGLDKLGLELRMPLAQKTVKQVVGLDKQLDKFELKLGRLVMVKRYA